jgi:hypothetical protein
MAGLFPNQCAVAAVSFATAEGKKETSKARRFMIPPEMAPVFCLKVEQFGK